MTHLLSDAPFAPSPSVSPSGARGTLKSIEADTVPTVETLSSHWSIQHSHCRRLLATALISTRIGRFSSLVKLRRADC